jgi:pre-rRNA-processing protein IPI3
MNNNTSLQNKVLLIGSNQENEMYVADATSGGQLYQFKNCRATRGGLQVIPRTDHLVGIQDNKLAIHLWTWSKDMPVYKCHVAEKMGPTTTTSCGNFLLAGAQSGKMYIWDVQTGELIMVWDAHYKGITAVALTSDDSHLITAGEDAVVNVWRLMDILDETDLASGFQQGITPLVSWTDHVLPVTSIHVSLGGVNARIYTSSLDRTCKIWTLTSNQCLFSVSCPSFVNVCLTDLLEHRLFMGCGDGKIYVLDLNAAASSLTAATARLVRSNVVVGNSNTSPWDREAFMPNAFEGHEAPVVTLQVSSCGGFLISGCDKGSVRVWDSVSRQCLRTISFFKGRVSTLLLISRPANLFHKQKTKEQNKRNCLIPIEPLKKYMSNSQS